jgi:GT2 family glycosyltransferase
MNKKVSIILLNYNGYEDTIECFKSLEKISYPNYNIIIIDNNSPDKSALELDKYFTKNNIKHKYFEDMEKLMPLQDKIDVVLIQSGFNGGYGHGNNIGIKYALNNNADYIMLLNNDTIVEKDFLEPLVEECIMDPEIGIISSQIFFYDKKDYLWSNGGTYNKITGKIRHKDYNKKNTIPQGKNSFLTGCLWLMPKTTLEKCGYINEEYFMYIEDLEYTFRVQKLGLKLRVSNKSKIYHKVGSSSGGELTNFSVYWRTKNYLKFMKKNINFIYWPIHLFSNILIFSVNIIRNKKIKLLLTQSKAIKDFIFKKNENQ